MTRRSVPLLLALLAAAPLAAQAPDTARVPDDPAVRTGTLPNGLRYYVRRNAEPPARAELRLVVNAGSVLEDDDQRGLAHLVEHMAFNGTRRFPEHALVDFLERVGMRFGPDVNAYTSFDETVYLLTLPTDTAGVLETGLDVLEDWATAVTFDTAEIRRERPVVLEERRLGRGAAARVNDREFPVLFAGSRYAERLPIGDARTLETFPPEALVRFYRDWYRPDLMAVVAVGDFDAAWMEARIRERFARIPPAADPRPRPSFDVPRGEATRWLVTADPELATTTVTLAHTLPAPPRGTVGAYRASLVETLYAGLLADRLNERTRVPDPPFLGVTSYFGTILRPVSGGFVSAEAAADGADRALAALVEEFERAGRRGFTATELERQKALLRRMWEQMEADRERTTSAQLAGESVGHFLYGGALPSLETEIALQRRLLPTITLAEVDARAREWAARGTRSVLVSAPARPGGALPDTARLRLVADSVARGDLAAYVDAVGEGPLLPDPPAPGRIVAEERIPEIGVTAWTLSNGARVLVKPTDFRREEIFLAGRSPGGTSLAPDAAWADAVTATAAAQAGGVGTWSVSDLTKRLAGVAAVAGTDIAEDSEGVSGYASPRDLETMFQLVHLYVTRPRRDSLAWEAYRDRAREMVRHRDASPEAAWADTLTAVLTGGHPRARPLRPADFDALSLDRSLALYRERFADAGDFTFVLVGNVTVDSVRPLVERYLATLPSTGRREAARDLGIRAPEGVVRRTVRRGVEAKGRTRLVFHGPAPFDRRTLAQLRTLADALQLRLRDELREELGATYAVTVAGSATREPVPSFRFVIDFGADPARLEELTARVMETLARVRAEGITDGELEKVREAHRREREVRLRENDVWLSQLLAFDRHGWDLRDVAAPPLSAALTREELTDAARRFLDPSRYVQVSLVPER